MSILIVDDDTNIRRVLSLRLQAEGFDVDSVESAEMALHRLNHPDPPEQDSDVDLILMDNLMPDLSGIEACRRLKSNPVTRDIPVIIMTAASDIENLRQAFDAGAMDYLSKPFNKVEMTVRIGSALRLKHEIDQRKQHERELMKTTEKLQLANANLKRLSTHDSLTGLYNRRYFDSALSKEYKRAKRSRRPISLIMIDIDWFKDFNDRYGHQAGDDCLRTIAREFGTVINRSHDLVARYGGEEFAIVLPDTPEVGALELAEDLRSHIASLNIRAAMDKGAPGVTISLGVASLVPDMNSEPEQLISAADSALYNAKRLGRNRATGTGPG